MLEYFENIFFPDRHLQQSLRSDSRSIRQSQRICSDQGFCFIMFFNLFPQLRFALIFALVSLLYVVIFPSASLFWFCCPCLFYVFLVIFWLNLYFVLLRISKIFIFIGKTQIGQNIIYTKKKFQIFRDKGAQRKQRDEIKQAEKWKSR